MKSNTKLPANMPKFSLIPGGEPDHLKQVKLLRLCPDGETYRQIAVASKGEDLTDVLGMLNSHAALVAALDGALDGMCAIIDETAKMPETEGSNLCFDAIKQARAALALAKKGK